MSFIRLTAKDKPRENAELLINIDHITCVQNTRKKDGCYIATVNGREGCILVKEQFADVESAIIKYNTLK